MYENSYCDKTIAAGSRGVECVQHPLKKQNKKYININIDILGKNCFFTEVVRALGLY